MGQVGAAEKGVCHLVITAVDWGRLPSLVHDFSTLAFRQCLLCPSFRSRDSRIAAKREARPRAEREEYPAMTTTDSRSTTRRGCRAEIERRRAEVVRLRSQGHSLWEIGRRLHVSGKTVARDLIASRDRDTKPLSEAELRTLVYEALARFDLVQKMAWQEFEDLRPGASGRLASLDLVRRTECERLKLLRELGVLGERALATPRADEAAPLDWSPEFSERLARALIEADTLEPVAEEGDRDPH